MGGCSSHAFRASARHWWGVSDSEKVPRPDSRFALLGVLPLAGLGLALVGVNWWAIQVRGLSQFYLVIFCVYLAAVALVLRQAGVPRRTDATRLARRLSRARLAIIVGVALIVRLIHFLSTPTLSDDLYRYIWDGKLLNAGLNPYLYPADATELAGLRGPLWAGIADKWTYTPYPPLSELAFALAYRLAPDSFDAMQGLGLVADLAVLALIALLLRQFGMAGDRLLIYAWSPLPAIHYVHSGHNDPLMIAGFLLAIYCLAEQRPVLSGAAFAASVLVKFHSLVLAPNLLPRWGWRGVAGGLVTTLVLYAPFLAGGPAIFRGLSSEAGDRVFNDGGHFLLRWLVQRFVEDGGPAARLLAGLIVLAAGVYFLRRPDQRLAALWERSYFMIGLLLFFSPMVQPWYLGWILPFLCFALRPGAGWWPFAWTPAFGWVLWTGTVGLTDFTYVNNTRYLWWSLRAIEYLPLALLCAWAAWRSQAARAGLAALRRWLGSPRPASARITRPPGESA